MFYPEIAPATIVGPSEWSDSPALNKANPNPNDGNTAQQTKKKSHKKFSLWPLFVALIEGPRRIRCFYSPLPPPQEASSVTTGAISAILIRPVVLVVGWSAAALCRAKSIKIVKLNYVETENLTFEATILSKMSQATTSDAAGQQRRGSMGMPRRVMRGDESEPKADAKSVVKSSTSSERSRSR